MVFVKAPAVWLLGKKSLKGMGAVVDVAPRKILKAGILQIEEECFLQSRCARLGGSTVNDAAHGTHTRTTREALHHSDWGRGRRRAPPSWPRPTNSGLGVTSWRCRDSVTVRLYALARLSAHQDPQHEPGDRLSLPDRSGCAAACDSGGSSRSDVGHQADSWRIARLGLAIQTLLFSLDRISGSAPGAHKCSDCAQVFRLCTAIPIPQGSEMLF